MSTIITVREFLGYTLGLTLVTVLLSYAMYTKDHEATFCVQTTEACIDTCARIHATAKDTATTGHWHCGGRMLTCTCRTP